MRTYEIPDHIAPRHANKHTPRKTLDDYIRTRREEGPMPKPELPCGGCGRRGCPYCC